MTTKTSYRRHAPEFKLRLCREIRSGQLGRRDAQKKFSLSDNLIHRWLAQYDSDQLRTEETDGPTLADCEAHVQALERKVGQLTMQLEGLCKKP